MERLADLELVGDEDECFIYQQQLIERTREAIYQMLTNPNKQCVNLELTPFKVYSPKADTYRQVMGYK